MENNILTFKKKGDFYARVATRYVDKGEYLSAVGAFRRAIERDPSNAENRVGLAALFSEMACYEKSNLLLFRVMHEQQEISPECHYGMGCNFLGLQEFTQAQDCLLTYLKLEPDGRFADDAEQMLSYIEEEYEIREEDGLEPFEVQQEAERAKRALDQGEAQQCVDILLPIVKTYPKLLYARNNLALAYYLLGEKELALQHAYAVLKRDGQNIHVLCNLAIFLGLDNEDKLVRGYLDRVAQMTDQLPDEAYKAALTMFEAGRLEDALRFFEQRLGYYPYDERTLFNAGVCAYNLKQYHKAKGYFDILAKVEEEGGVGAYFRNLALQGQEQAKEIAPLTLHMQVPLIEAVDRVRYLNTVAKGELTQVQGLWRHDAQFRSTIKWALSLADSSVQNAMMDLLGLLADDQAEETLRAYLMDPEPSQTQKNKALSILKGMGAREPYVLWAQNGIAQAHVTMVDTFEPDTPACYLQVLERCVQAMHPRAQSETVEMAVSLWSAYVNTMQQQPKSLQHHEAWAAAIEVVAAEMMGQEADLSEIAQHYEAQPALILNRVRRIYAGLKDAEKRKQR